MHLMQSIKDWLFSHQLTWTSNLPNDKLKALVARTDSLEQESAQLITVASSLVMELKHDHVSHTKS